MTEDYSELKQRHDNLVRQRDRAQAKNEQAGEQLRKLIEEITSQFSVKSLPEAKEKLAFLIQQRNGLALKIAAELDKVDG